MRQLLTATALILLIVGLRAALGRRISGRLRYALWLPVALRLLLPGTFLPVLPPPAAPAAAVTVAAPAEAAGGAAVDSALPAPASGGAEAAAQNEVSGGPDVWTVVWAAGTAATGLAFLGSAAVFTRRLRRDRTALAVPDCPLPVYVTGAAVSPCLFGFLRPAVYLTPDAAADPDVRRQVVAHETCHFRRGDHWSSLLRCVCLTIYWFHPLVWLASALAQTDMELACDETVLTRAGKPERLAYGKTLVDTVAVRPTAMPGPLWAAGRGTLRRRLERIARPPRLSRGAGVAAAALAVLLTGCAFLSPADAAEPPAEGAVLTYEAVDVPAVLAEENEVLRYSYAAGADVRSFHLWAEFRRNGTSEVLSSLTLYGDERLMGDTLELAVLDNDWETVEVRLHAGGATAEPQAVTLPEGINAKGSTYAGHDGSAVKAPVGTPVLLYYILFNDESRSGMSVLDCATAQEDPSALDDATCAVAVWAEFGPAEADSGPPSPDAPTSDEPTAATDQASPDGDGSISSVGGADGPTATTDQAAPQAPTSDEPASDEPTAATDQAAAHGEAPVAGVVRVSGGQATAYPDTADLAEAICQDTLVRSAAWPAVPLPDAYWHITGSAAELDVFYLDGRPVSQWGDQYTYLSEELMDRLEALA